ncbi:hypothetical protein [Actinoplanes italicus]|uniref:Uncharacterized protein n=1 Tax=Actinoplanes italicus TaxID=113567 RepID=A0A2T0K2E0_9ACTN|nr:hypothetical protein [Actinoplanes italicus]PRX16974.1 hypothetical protein CLV67_11730 [Actinoplanes italicus]
MREWTSADVWVLKILIGTGSENPSDLGDIVMRGDAMEHAVLEEREFTTAAGNLVAAGLVEFGDDGYWLTEAGRELTNRRRDIERRLVRLGEPRGTPLELAPGEFTRAVDGYLGRFAS